MFILLLLEESNAQKIEDVYGLNGQIEHKIAFLRAHVPKDVKLILIGHSVGTYMTLHVMKRVPELPVSMPLKVIFFFFGKQREGCVVSTFILISLLPKMCLRNSHNVPVNNSGKEVF